MPDEPLTCYFRERGVAQLGFGAGIQVPQRFGNAVDEHHAVRSRVGLFDFSFMSHFEISGPQSAVFLQRLQPRAVTSLRAGRIVYTFLCRDDGSVFNDATIWRHSDGRFWLFTGRRSDLTHIRQIAHGLDVFIDDLSGAHSIIAVQGPLSDALLGRAGVESGAPVRYFRFSQASIAGTGAWIGRIGYSGERGYELLVDAAHGVEIWKRMVAAGRDLGVAECGFQAADSLRIEAGYMLFDRELRYRVTPAGLGYGQMAVPRPQDDYVGASALHARRGRDEPVRLVGLVPVRTLSPADWLLDTASLPTSALPPVAPRQGCLTSACWSPTLARLLGLGYVAGDDRYPGSSVTLQNGQRAQVARLPFYDPPRLRPRR